MESPVNHLVIRNELDELDSLFEEFTVLKNKIKSLRDEDDQMLEENFILKVDQIVCKSKTEALYWLLDFEQKFNSDESVKLRSSKKSSSKCSKSSASSTSGSSRKSVRDRMVEEAAKLASVKAEADCAVN